MAWTDDFTWVEKVTRLGPTALNKVNTAIRRLKGLSFDPTDYGCVGDGVSDDSVGLQAALTAVAAASGKLVAPRGKTYLVSSGMSVTAGCALDFQGSTIKKKSTMTTEAITVSGSEVTIRNLVLDGNKAGGATERGINWLGATGKLENATIKNCKATAGVYVSGDLTCVNVASTGHGNVTGDADGFSANTNGKITLDVNCSASGNTRAGVFVNTTATGCHVDGDYSRNIVAGVWIVAGNAGTSGYLYCHDNDSANVSLDKQAAGVGVSDWKFGIVQTADQGKTGAVLSGSNLRLAGCSRCQFGTVISRGGNGWAVLFASGDGSGGTGVGASDCSIGALIADNTGAADTDPGISFQFGSKRNHIGFASVRGHSWAVTFSEELAPVGNDNNTIGELHATGCPWGIVFARGGSYNHIGRIVGRDCGNADPTLAKGLIEWQRHPISGGGVNRGNTVGFLDYRDTRTTSTRPLALVRADSTESGNAVLDGVARGCDTDTNDENGANPVTLRPMLRQTSIETFESGFSGGADNTTAGQFVEGTKGRRLVSNTGGSATITHTGLSLDFSAMGDDEWFRLFVYLEVVSDKHPTSPIALRFGTDPTGATNYYQWIVAPEALRVNGAQYLRLRKGGFAATGSPSWASIVRIDCLAISSAANTFAVTFDNLERIYPDRYATHIGGIAPHGQPAADGTVLTATGKLWSKDAGTWKSVAIS